MKINRLTYTLALIAAIAAVACALSWRGAPAARAASSANDKVSADLKLKLNGGDSKVDVVIKSAGSWNSTLDNAVKNNNGSIKKSYTNFPVRTVSLPPSAVNALAARTDVEYIALDREVKLLGHISLTSGADAARVMGNYAPTYDGTGVGIAVLDSGIDPNHVSMTVESG